MNLMTGIIFLISFQKKNIKSFEQQEEEVHNYKFSKLMGTKLEHDPEKVIYNISSFDLIQTERSLLLNPSKAGLFDPQQWVKLNLF